MIEVSIIDELSVFVLVVLEHRVMDLFSCHIDLRRMCLNFLLQKADMLLVSKLKPNSEGGVDEYEAFCDQTTMQMSMLRLQIMRRYSFRVALNSAANAYSTRSANYENKIRLDLV